ncbi:hypothetical protein [Pseudomonas frederiksbergensis]|uniref:hypothetical protein n=1 Tax=Pseudomonas frederiksbergensis TaxID=104087 RepID=UPI003D1958EC
MFSRLNTLVSGLFHAVSGLVVLVLILHVAFFNWQLMTPRDVGGTFMGGGMETPMYLMSWGVALLGLVIAVLLRLPGAIGGWIGSGLVPLGIGTWWQLNYPDNDTGNAIYSISEHEIGSFMIIGVILLSSGLYAREKLKNREPDPEQMPVQFIAAVLLAAFFIGVPLAKYKQASLPHCAFNKSGEQLTVCIGDKRVIID